MGIAAQPRQVTHLWEGDTQIREEVVQGGSIAKYGLGLQGRGEGSDMILQDLFEIAVGWLRSGHRFLGGKE
jgi:hypothetical protein